MHAFTRHILWELTKVFLITLAAMTLLTIGVGLLHEAIRQGLGVEPILRLLPYILPDALRFSVPGTILFSACIVYGRMSAANEITAIKSLGISPLTVVWPALVLAFFISLATVWLNDVAISWGKQGIQRVVVESVEQIAYGVLRRQRSYSTSRFSINVREVDGDKLIQPTVSFTGDGDSPPVTLTAQLAWLKANPEENTLSIILENGVIESGEPSLDFSDRMEWNIPLADATHKSGGQEPTDRPLSEIPAAIGETNVKIERLTDEYAVEAAYQMLAGDLNRLAGAEWDRRRERLQRTRQQRYRLEAEPWRRWSNGFSCLLFVLVGAPLAILMRRSDFWTTFLVCFLPILCVYYPLMALGVEQAKSGDWPAYAVWLPNLALAPVGLLLLRQVQRY